MIDIFLNFLWYVFMHLCGGDETSMLKFFPGHNQKYGYGFNIGCADNIIPLLNLMYFWL